MRIFQIPSSNIIGNKPLGQIKGSNPDMKYNNVVKGYLDGEIPILIETNLTQEEWDRMVDGKLTEEDKERLRARGIL